MNKQEAFEDVQEAIRAYNEELEVYQSNVQELTGLDEPFANRPFDPEDIEMDILGSFDLPTGDAFIRAGNRLEQALEAYQNATGVFQVYVTFLVQGSDADEASDHAKQALEGLELQDCDGQPVTFHSVDDVDVYDG